MNSKRPVIFVVGATASGKSDWALRLAEHFKGVIFNCDSIQVYQQLDIGAAKPSLEEQKRVPHYLLDYVAPPQEMTAGIYSRDFYEALEKIPENVPVFVVGGTGFYFMAIEKGMYPIIPVDPEVQKQVATELAKEGGPLRLHQELLAKDPEYGAKIHLRDHYRIGRALELIRSQGKSVTEIQDEFAKTQNQFPYPLLKLGPKWEKEALDARIARRTEIMLKMGLVDEVRKLLDQGLESWAPMSSVGYRETISYVKGEMSLEALELEIAKNTRQLAKKQRTWFQRDADIHWFAGGEEGYLAAFHVVEKFLNS
ncbi:tRNA dimethylallyltransferase [Bdellovibrio bacteriovorus]|uniref:tRNA dimethylallyltransferase n=1 Tax=Bdellovibrio bacteriovorus TaxID=959 RepID=A0A150WLL4_BDEBC|nr:tRNA (adenosine(37)-N6)-dimethylallyltransferase MiaA [Bdellovibrio bacteriovorus]KYG64899.1 tRNA dimethylallyltransferase [Bdellovibrio bacteriovorus]